MEAEDTVVLKEREIESYTDNWIVEEDEDADVNVANAYLKRFK